MKFTAIILAGGSGERFGSTIPKQFMSLNGKLVIQYCLDVIEPLVDEVIIVANEQYKNYKTVRPGSSRSESAENGFKASTGDFIIFHDAVRPFITAREIEELKQLLLNDWKSVDTAVDIVDGYLEDGFPKEKTGRQISLTPEGFPRDILRKAFTLRVKNYQDEVSMVYDLLGLKPAIVYGTQINSKITYERDLGFAEGIMANWAQPLQLGAEFWGKVLVFGGSGDIGQACCARLDNYCAPSRQELNLAKSSFDFTLNNKPILNLKDFRSIIYAAGSYKNDWEMMEVNFWSAVRLIELAEEQNWQGNIVFLSSTAGAYGRPGTPIYSASKAALNSLIQSRHVELAGKGIFINAIAPAKVRGKLQQALNPEATELLEPLVVADYVCRYLNTDRHGDIIYLRVGVDYGKKA
ncbi:MAG: SDR family NAD(P)-dependent oxidoreductase [Candidatus Komeilibacteria bacterium]|nr:SDR family NAD(P)-dependent oxidoreductase [Candidatus Komeilibacteria bacterium]